MIKIEIQVERERENWLQYMYSFMPMLNVGAHTSALRWYLHIEESDFPPPRERFYKKHVWQGS